jgi:hypothetical protein
VFALLVSALQAAWIMLAVIKPAASKKNLAMTVPP